VVALDRQAMSSEDFSIYINHVPHGAFFRLGIKRPGEEEQIIHNDRYDYNDDALPSGIAVLTQFVLLKNG
jgi:amidohydrolase